MTVSLPWVEAGLPGGFVDSWNRILAIGKARTTPGPRSADMRLRPGLTNRRGHGPCHHQTVDSILNRSFMLFFNSPATIPA